MDSRSTEIGSLNRIALKFGKRPERSHNLKHNYRGFEILRNLTIRRLNGYWNGFRKTDAESITLMPLKFSESFVLRQNLLYDLGKNHFQNMNCNKICFFFMFYG